MFCAGQSNLTPRRTRTTTGARSPFGRLRPFPLEKKIEKTLHARQVRRYGGGARPKAIKFRAVRVQKPDGIVGKRSALAVPARRPVSRPGNGKLTVVSVVTGTPKRVP